jgi:hypothetical protein
MAEALLILALYAMMMAWLENCLHGAVLENTQHAEQKHFDVVRSEDFHL